MVDDDPMILGMLDMFLKKNGYQVTLSLNPIEASELMLGSSYDLILCDEHMPRMNGTEFCRSIRRKGDTDIPIVLMSATVPDGLDEIAAECGANAAMRKPFDLRKLHTLIKRLMA